jgi:hypothetical protein
MSHNITNILNYYKDVESFSPPLIAYSKEGKGPIYSFQKINKNTKRALHIKGLHEFFGFEYFFSKLYIGLIKKDKVYEAYLDNYQGDTKQKDVTYLCSMNINDNGVIDLDSMNIPFFVTTLMKIKSGDGSANHEDMTENLIQSITNFIVKNEFTSFMDDLDKFRKVLHFILSEINVFSYDDLEKEGYLECIEPSKIEAVLKNSGKVFPSDAFPNFYIKDLNKITQETDVEIQSTALGQYLMDTDKIEKRYFVASDKNEMKISLNPNVMTHASWPSKGLFPLVSAQQVAVNNFFRFHVNQNKPGLYSCNGPPGSGKTTMMQDVIANLIKDRAKRMLDLELKGFSNIVNISIDSEVLPVYIPNKELTGFEIVVASSNNTAVENITKELTSRENSAASVLGDFHYLSVSDKEWGTVSACLGNRDNKDRFLEILGLKMAAQSTTTVLKKIDELSFNDTVHNDFKKNKGTIERVLKDAYNINTVKNQSEQYMNIVKELDPTSIWEKSLNEIHLSSPLNNKRINAGKVNLFVQALNIHKNFIVANKTEIVNNLRLVNSLFAGKIHDAEAAKAIWQTLFLVVPVVSTTYASFGNLFKDLGAGDLGVLISDESGQAMPHVCIGALWRTKYAMIVGDPLQIDPVVNITQEIDKKLIEKYDIKPFYQVSSSSMQEVADIVNPYGDIIKLSEGDKWIGSPLRVHRRCANPMFDLANKIAYDNTMIHAYMGDTKSPITDILGESFWFDISDSGAKDNHFNENEYQFLKYQLKRVIMSDTIPDGGLSIYVISPFRTVHEKTRDRLMAEDDWDNGFFKSERMKKEFLYNNLGTVHKFQGKEADVVFFLLGGSREKENAINWATQGANLPNVALTRAKKAFYVIGNKELWSKNHFKDIANVLTK